MKDNKLIAELMSGEHPFAEVTHEAHHNYDTSWDWLMPVVSKIARNEEYFENVLSERLFDIVPFGRIEEVYEVVVEFIEDYNDEK